MPSAARIAAIVLRQFYLLRGSPVRIFPLFAWVAIDILLWGFISKYLQTVATPGLSLLATLLGAVLLWDFFTRVMHGIATAFLEDVWSRNFLNLFASPLTVAEYLAGLVITSIATSLVGLLVMLGLAILVFGLSYASYGIVIVAAFLVLFLFGIALGIFGTATVLRFGPASEWFVWPLPALISPFAAVFYPLSTLPAWMQWLAFLVPPSYVFEWMRASLSGAATSPMPIFFAAGLSVAYIVLASWFFARIFRQAVRTGLIARYSAESVS
jgi:ABC-2 type transport system permease protein